MLSDHGWKGDLPLLPGDKTNARDWLGEGDAGEYRATCRQLLESLVVKLERTNQQLVSWMGDQSQEIRGLRKDIATSNLPDAYANNWRPQAVALLVGDSVLRDVRVDQTLNGIPIKIRRKSGATLADIEQMVDDAAKTETIDIIIHRWWYSRNN